MQKLRSKDDAIPDFDRFGHRPLLRPSDPPPSARIQHRMTPSPRSFSPSISPRESPRATNNTQSTEEFLRDALDRHNEFRRRHDVGPLALNHELCQLAQKWGKKKCSLSSLSIMMTLLIFFV